ncbi:MAG TPA: PqqD family protein [Acidimicrobiia bacterium]|nr:PqqD family protein [Acidimicrobiia bacterium]
MNGQTIVRRSKRVAFQRIADGGVLLHLDTGAYHRVNGVGALIWEALEEDSGLSEVVAKVEGSVEGPVPDELSAEVEVFLESLAERDLVILEQG